MLDTNVLISAAISKGTPLRVFRWVLDHGVLLASREALDELTSRFLERDKFDRYLSLSGRAAFIAEVVAASENVSTVSRLAVCADPDDDRFAELAVDGRADCIVTGNTRDFPEVVAGVPVLTPAAFAARYVAV